MKKLLVVLLALTMLLSVLSLASCGGKGKGDAETGETTAEQTEFTVGWKNWNGDFIKVDPKVAKGTLPVFGQADPTRPEDDDYVYTFAGWEPAIAPVTANVIYTATYTATEKSKTTITADQFNAMWSSFGGKNLVVNAENIYIRHSLSMLEDGSHYVTSVYAEENTTVYHVGVPMPDGKIAVFSGMLNKKSGVIEWEFDDVITAGEFIAEQTNKSGGVLAGFGAYKPYASNFADYTYDEAGEFYRANGTVDDFNWEHDMERLATLPRQAEWEAYVSQFQGCRPGARSDEKWQLMERIF